MRGDVYSILPIKVDGHTDRISALISLSCINVKNHFSYILAYCHYILVFIFLSGVTDIYYTCNLIIHV